MTGAIALAIGTALGWLHVLTGWGVNFPSQRPPLALRIVALVLLVCATAWLAWFFWRSL